MQQVYLVAFDKLAEFRTEASIATWLTRIAVNEALGRLRRRRPSLELSVLDAAPRTNAHVITFPTHTDPERGAALKQIRQLIEHAIDELPDGFRAVFVMRDIEAMSVAETADVLALSPATVKTRLHRARRLLRRALDAQLASALSDTSPLTANAVDRRRKRCWPGSAYRRRPPAETHHRRADTTAGEPQAARAQCAQASFHRRRTRTPASCRGSLLNLVRPMATLHAFGAPKKATSSCRSPCAHGHLEASSKADQRTWPIRCLGRGEGSWGRMGGQRRKGILNAAQG